MKDQIASPLDLPWALIHLHLMGWLMLSGSADPLLERLPMQVLALLLLLLLPLGPHAPATPVCLHWPLVDDYLG